MNVRFKFPSGAYKTFQVIDTVKCTPHFTFEELGNNSSKEAVTLVMDTRFFKFMECIEAFRTWYGKPMKCNSCYRTEEYNAKVGGDPKSAHLLGCAMDWGISGLTDADYLKFSTKWEQICKEAGLIGAINYYTNGLHLEAFSDICYGSKTFKVRNYRGKKGDW